MFSNSLGSLSPPMQWPSEIGYPKVRQSERFWTIIRMLIFLSIIFSHSHHQHNTRGGVMDWHSRPASLPSPGGPGIRRLRTFGGWGGSATWNKVLFFQFLILESFEIGEIINSFSCQKSQPKYSKWAFHQYVKYFSSFSPGSQTYCGFTLQCDFSSW